MSGGTTPKNMDRWLGDGGMPIIAAVGGAFVAYGVDGEDLGWVAGTFTPEDLACNPHGVTQAGVHSLLLDACMNFAINLGAADWCGSWHSTQFAVPKGWFW